MRTLIVAITAGIIGWYCIVSPVRTVLLEVHAQLTQAAQATQITR